MDTGFGSEAKFMRPGIRIPCTHSLTLSCLEVCGMNFLNRKYVQQYDDGNDLKITFSLSGCENVERRPPGPSYW
jgi:hypothetical protein